MADAPKNQRCNGCRYFVEKDDNFGFCRRSPPVAFMDYEHTPVVGHDNSISRMVKTHPNGWCGEWSPANPETFDDAAVTLARFVILGDKTAARALVDKIKEE
jgi:hypothetical protein